jgi:flagellin
VGDGISLVQTAEGALQEVQDMLNRMVTLAEESANGTYQDDVDRENLQAEMDALKEEINRIADSANFNGISLLDGSLTESTVITNPTDVTVTAVNDGAHNGEAAAGKFTVDLSQLSFTSKLASGSNNATITMKIGGATICASISCTAAASGVTIATLGASTGTTVTGKQLASAVDGKYVKLDGVAYTIKNNGDGTITLEASKAPTTTPTASLAVTFVYTDTTGAVTTDVVSNQGNGQSVHVVAQPVSADASKMAQGKFDLTADMVKDGNVLNIGGTSYVFKVGADSNVTGQNLIDLSAYNADSTDTTEIKNMIQEAAVQISQKSNDKFIVSTTNNATSSKVQIDLTEKEGKVDYAKDWNLAGSATTAADGDWSGVVTYGALDNSKTTAGLTLQIGDTSDSWNQMTVSIKDMHTSSLQIDSIDIKTQSNAAAAISVIKDAINYVSSTRGTLGATQNRLEHTANNLSVMTENIQDAESTIRDTDSADEMTAYTKNQILVQSAQAMLAQANSVPQGVLQLLQ